MTLNVSTAPVTHITAVVKSAEDTTTRTYLMGRL